MPANENTFASSDRRYIILQIRTGEFVKAVSEMLPTERSQVTWTASKSEAMRYTTQDLLPMLIRLRSLGFLVISEDEQAITML